MYSVTPSQQRVLLTTVSSDSHTWNLVYLHLALEEAGHDVVNLGPCVPDDVLVATAAKQLPDVLIVSTVNGHGCLDGARVIKRLREHPATASIPAVIGGKLGIDDAGDDVATQLLDAGFNAVFTDNAGPSELTQKLAALTRDERPALPSACQ